MRVLIEKSFKFSVDGITVTQFVPNPKPQEIPDLCRDFIVKYNVGEIVGEAPADEVSGDQPKGKKGVKK